LFSDRVSLSSSKKDCRVSLPIEQATSKAAPAFVGRLDAPQHAVREVQTVFSFAVN
jgi:hypothetical protein